MADIVRGDVLHHGGPFIGLLNGTVTRGDPVGNNATGWVRADADAVISCQGFALADGVSGDFIPICKWCIQQTTTDLTTGGMLFLSATVGRIADAVVGALGTMSQLIGWVVRGAGTEMMYLNSEIAHVEATAEIALDSGTLLIVGQFINFFVADRNYRVVGAREVHSVAGTDGSAVTCTVEKIPSGTAKASGVNVLSTTFNLKSTANTPVWLGPSTTVADIRLVPGDRLGLLSSGTLTSLIDCCVTVELIVGDL